MHSTHMRNYMIYNSLSKTQKSKNTSAVCACRVFLTKFSVEFNIENIHGINTENYLGGSYSNNGKISFITYLFKIFENE